jgi:hypothetical protein
MRALKDWLRETHGATFELFRHFLARFFDSDLATAPGQMTAVWIGSVPVLFQWFFLLVAPLRRKYAILSTMGDAGLYREAVRADELWLITLMMSAIGLLTAVKWQLLFPDLRDYRALGTLPLRPRQMFGAKLAALFTTAAAVLVTLNFLPSIGFPALSGGGAAGAPLETRMLAHAGASMAASAFFFFGLVALEGVMLNLLPPRAFGNLTGYLQGILVALMLGLVVMSFSIQPQIAALALRPDWAHWLPPVWFLGLHEALTGDPDPAMKILANRAIWALGIAAVLTLLTYLTSYHRHRKLMMEGISKQSGEWRLGNVLVERLSHDPREQAVLGFFLETLARSNHHRTIAMGYAGLVFALLVTGVAGMDKVFGAGRVVAARFIYYHVLALVFLIVGARHLFSLPSELKANWLFQATESDDRIEWLQAVDRFVIAWGLVLILAIPLPLEIWLLGPRGIAEVVLFAALGLVAYEWAFFNWDKLPFTCSHLPGKTPVWMILAFFGLLGLLALVHTLLVATLYSPVVLIVVSAASLAGWVQLRRERRKQWTYLRLKYEDAPEPAVHALNLLH